MAWSSWIATVAVLALGVAADGCGDDDPGPADGCSKTSAALASSLKTWRQVRGDGNMTYWYEEEDCAPNKNQGEVNTVRVDANGAHVVMTRQIEPSDCQAQVNRLENFEAQTFEALYATCEKLATRECDARVETDGQGVLRSCTWEGDELCADNCGEGFHLRRWGFGDAPE